MKRFSFFFFGIFFIGISASFASEEWLDNANGYARGRDQAAHSSKPMVIYFYTDWCPYCRKFEKNTLIQPEVQKVLSSFVKVRINPEKGSREGQIADQYHVDGYPAVFFENPASKQVTQEMTKSVRTAQEFAFAANQFSETSPKAAAQPKKNKQVSSASASKIASVSRAIQPEQILYLKSGRKISGKIISEDEKGLTFATADLDDVYFSRAEIQKIEKI